MARVLLDECVDRRLAPLVEGHEVTTTHARRWLGLADRTLLDRCEGRIDVFVTVDTNLKHQQNLAQYSFAVVVLRRTQGGSVALQAVAEALRAAIPVAQRGEALEVIVP